MIKINRVDYTQKYDYTIHKERGMKMMTTVLWGLFAAVCAVCLVLIIAFNIVHFVCKLKCITKHYNKYTNACNNDKCWWNNNCDNYEHVFTIEEVTRLTKLIEQWKKR